MGGALRKKKKKKVCNTQRREQDKKLPFEFGSNDTLTKNARLLLTENDRNIGLVAQYGEKTTYHKREKIIRGRERGSNVIRGAKGGLPGHLKICIVCWICERTPKRSDTAVTNGKRQAEKKTESKVGELIAIQVFGKRWYFKKLKVRNTLHSDEYRRRLSQAGGQSRRTAKDWERRGGTSHA